MSGEHTAAGHLLSFVSGGSLRVKVMGDAFWSFVVLSVEHANYCREWAAKEGLSFVWDVYPGLAVDLTPLEMLALATKD